MAQPLLHRYRVNYSRRTICDNYGTYWKEGRNRRVRHAQRLEAGRLLLLTYSSRHYGGDKKRKLTIGLRRWFMSRMDKGTNRFYGWMSVSIGGMVIFLSMGFMFSYQILVPVLRTEFGWNAAVVGGAASVTMLVLGFFSPLSGGVIAKFGPRKGIVAGNFLMALGFLIMGLQTEVWHLYLGYGVLVGIGACLGGMLPAMTLANNWFIRKRSMAMSIITFSSSVGGFAILPLMSFAVGLLGWRAGCFIIAAALLVCGVVIPWFAVRNRPEDMGQTPDGGFTGSKEEKDRKAHPVGIYTTPVEFSLKDAMRTKSLWLIAYGFVASQFLSSVMTTHQIAFLENLGISGITGALAAGLMYGVGIFGALGIGVLGLRFNMRRLNAIAVGIIVFGCFLLLAAKTLAFVYLYNIFLGIGVGAFTTGYIAQLSAYYGRTNFPKIMGVVFSFGTILGATGSLVAGILYDATGSYKAVFAVITLIFILSLLCIVSAKPPIHPLTACRKHEKAGSDSLKN